MSLSQTSQTEKVLRVSLCLLALCLAAFNLAPSSSGEENKPQSDATSVAYFTIPENQHWDAQNRYVDSIFIDSGAPVQQLRRHHYAVQFVPLPVHFGDQSLRVALWDHPKVPAAVLTSPPGFTELGRKDFLAWVGSGRNVVFTGGYATLSAMNALFGFELEYVPYREGPYWRNDRNVGGTPFQYGPARIEETGAAYGVKIDSIPLTGYSMYDTNRDSLVFYIKYNKGIVCYVGASFGDLDEADPWGAV
eukprot:CAMPEP_0173405064 /NCGR_PEP_ID=MMETSP1356-20130122/60913_1 /TAXON_ID=77927 ORGANISM="Hemiselmis virescens, Strain PCC157" /NCGR_SAMPLE_ID=MMETSP1356 /ASSEMBLY_ACC=CAM_ASM_000847 /LENGTH=247 /DNA_ID=CAMNT_0014365829 /DNA_START=130 /DNA_END=869 /DNA_ORIENTATION=-